VSILFSYFQKITVVRCVAALLVCASDDDDDDALLLLLLLLLGCAFLPPSLYVS